MSRGYLLLCVLGFLGVAFSGCAGKEGASAPAALPSDPSLSVPLVALITVFSADGLAIPVVNGSVPATVGANLTFNGFNSTGFNLTYAWDFGDNSTASSPVENHAYAAAGVYEVTLGVASGNRTASSRVAVNVTDVTATIAGPTWTDVETFTGRHVVGPLLNPVVDCEAPVASGVYCTDHKVSIVDVDPNGSKVLAKVARLTITNQGATAHTFYLYWRHGATNLASTGETASASAQPERRVTYEGEMVAGDYVARARCNIGAAADYKLVVEIDYFAA